MPRPTSCRPENKAVVGRIGTSFYCKAKVCPPVIGHFLVYKDRSQITAAFADTLAPYIERQVVAAITG